VSTRTTSTLTRCAGSSGSSYVGAYLYNTTTTEQNLRVGRHDAATEQLDRSLPGARLDAGVAGNPDRAFPARRASTERGCPARSDAASGERPPG
jgi:hypothetical protein